VCLEIELPVETIKISQVMGLKGSAFEAVE
jgi:hypothetical protein